jgi:hypothetical protein
MAQLILYDFKIDDEFKKIQSSFQRVISYYWKKRIKKQQQI